MVNMSSAFGRWDSQNLGSFLLPKQFIRPNTALFKIEVTGVKFCFIEQ